MGRAKKIFLLVFFSFAENFKIVAAAAKTSKLTLNFMKISSKFTVGRDRWERARGGVTYKGSAAHQFFAWTNNARPTRYARERID